MANDSKTWRCGKYELSFDRPRIMGVLNVTPDSFSDGGEHFDPDAAIEYGLAMLDAGADIIDVGGESTRPGFTPVNPDEEARRVLPVVRALAKEGAIVSIDTRHVAVAKAAVRCGASIVNDVTGFTDPKMVEFVKTSTCGVIVMHAGEVAAPTRTHATVQLDTSAAAFVAEKAREAAAEAAREAEKPARRRRGKLLVQHRLLFKRRLLRLELLDRCFGSRREVLGVAPLLFLFRGTQLLLGLAAVGRALRAALRDLLEERVRERLSLHGTADLVPALQLHDDVRHTAEDALAGEAALRHRDLLEDAVHVRE